MYKMMDSLVNGSENMLESVYLQGNLPPEHIYASPLMDDFHDVPPTLLAFGEHDFLAFEDFAYARHAHKAGVRLKTIIYRGLGHGFADQIGVMPQGEDLRGEIAAHCVDDQSHRIQKPPVTGSVEPGRPAPADSGRRSCSASP